MEMKLSCDSPNKIQRLWFGLLSASLLFAAALRACDSQIAHGQNSNGTKNVSMPVDRNGLTAEDRLRGRLFIEKAMGWLMSSSGLGSAKESSGSSAPGVVVHCCEGFSIPRTLRATITIVDFNPDDFNPFPPPGCPDAYDGVVVEMKYDVDTQWWYGFFGQENAHFYIGCFDGQWYGTTEGIDADTPPTPGDGPTSVPITGVSCEPFHLRMNRSWCGEAWIDVTE